MRKLKLLAVASVLFFGCTFFAQTAQAQTKTEYYVVVGWLKDYSGDKENRPFVSNVVVVNCDKWVGEQGVRNQFYDYFNAYYKKRTGYSIADVSACFEYKSYNEAENGRREQLAKYNNLNWVKEATYLFNDFKYICND